MAFRAGLRSARRGVGLAASLAVGCGAAAATSARCEPSALGPSFDPEALERGAKALREIGLSPLGKKALELSREQEKTRQQTAKTEEAHYQAAAQQAAVERERVKWEEQRKAMQAEMQNKAELARYNDELARKRGEADHEKSRQRNAELVVLQEDSAKRSEAEKRRVAEQIEAERRATERYKADLEKGVQRERALAEAEGRALEGRQNEDVNRRALLLRLGEERQKLLAAIDLTFRNLGAGVVALLGDTERLAMAVGGLSVAALGVYSAREGTRVAASALDRWLGTPRLVRETSRRGWWGGRGKTPSGEGEVRKDFGDIVLPPGLQGQVRSLAAVTANTRAHGAPFRHMLFYGPPGTGKSMAAKRLARTAGLDYAIMSGGDVAPLGGRAVQQLHELFDWAERSRKGLLLFIDEADAFLGRRGAQMSEGLRAALNAVLFRTGDQSRDFAVVLATNRPADLDAAMLDRLDEALEFPLPGLAERRDILEQYLDSYVRKAGTAQGGAGAASGGLWGRLTGLLRGRKAEPDTVKVVGVGSEELQEAAEATEGFSARELAKMVASMQAAVYGTANATLSADLFRAVLRRKVQEHYQRQAFLGDSVDT